MLKAAIMVLSVCKKLLKRKIESITKKPQCKNLTDFIKFGWPSIHRLTNPKGVHSFRYFLRPMHSPNLLMHIHKQVSDCGFPLYKPAN